MVPLAIDASGCFGGYVACDDDECEYVEAAPVTVEVYPQYVYRGVVVYDVHGRYYRRLGSRWVVYRQAPRWIHRVGSRREYERERPPHPRHHRPR
jgi:hypothetical protein